MTGEQAPTAEDPESGGRGRPGALADRPADVGRRRVGAELQAGAERPGASAAADFGTVERWAAALLAAPDPAGALALGRPPARAAGSRVGADPDADPDVEPDADPGAEPRGAGAPTRPRRLAGGDLGPPSRRSVRRGLARAENRAALLARFAHHELQAAELMAWALLRFATTPAPFRLGLARIADEELDHARRLEARVRALGFDPAGFPRRDWFWERVPACADPAAFCALMGLGLEAANLEHAALWAARLRSAGDPESAELQLAIQREELAHVRFARTWYERFAGPLEFESWRARLPAPLTPSVLRGPRLARGPRREAGFDEPFLDALDAWPPAAPG